MRIEIFIVLLCASFALSSCGSLFGPNKSVEIRTNPSGAKVFVGESYKGTTPITLRAKTNKGEITLQYEDCEPMTFKPQTTFNAVCLLDIIYPLAFVEAAWGGTSSYKSRSYYFDMSESIAKRDAAIKEAQRIEEERRAQALAEQKAREEAERQAEIQRQMNKKTLAITIPTTNATKVLSSQSIFKKYNKAVFMIYTSDGVNSFQGSGFFVSSTGIAISNYHVFKDTNVGLEEIKTIDGKTYKVSKVLAYSEVDDYIVFKIAGNNFSYIPITKRGIKIGEHVYALGSPRGLENTFSEGMVSQNRGDGDIQISVPIDHGSSGGALINKYGEIVGITSAGRDDSGANLNFAKDIRLIFK